MAHAVRDVLAQRWLQTEKTYARDNPKHVYYLSMEFLIGRSLANNVTNLWLDPLLQQTVKQKNLNWFELLEEEPDAGLGNGGLGRLAACFLDSMATMQLPAMGYGLRYEYGIFKQSIQDGWQHEEADNWLRRPDPWEVARPHEQVEVRLNCSFDVRGGTLCAIPGRPSTLLGIPFDRPVVGYGGKTINTLRLWSAAAPDFFDFQEFSSGDFVGALAETLSAESVIRVLYPHDSTSMGQGLRFVQEYFLVACAPKLVGPTAGAGYVFSMEVSEAIVWIGQIDSTAAERFPPVAEVIVRAQDAQGRAVDGVPVTFELEPAWVGNATLTPSQSTTQDGIARAVFSEPKTSSIVRVLARVDNTTAQARLTVETYEEISSKQ